MARAFLTAPQLPVVGSLPSAGNKGSLVTLSTDNHVYHDNGTSWDDITAQGSGSGGSLSWAVKTTTYTAVAGDGVLADTSGGPWTLTLPASPSIGDVVAIVDVANTFDTAMLIIGRNALKIMGIAEDMTCSTEGIAFTLVYSDATNGWRIV